MGWSYVSPHSDSDGSGQDTALCFLSMHLVFSYFIRQIKSQANPLLLFQNSNRGVKWEVNSWIRGNNSHMGLQIIDVFWLRVCDCNCNGASVLADISGGIFTRRFSDAFLMSLNHSPLHYSLAVTKWEANNHARTHTHTQSHKHTYIHSCSIWFSQIKSSVYHLSNNILFIRHCWSPKSTFH